MLDLLIKKNEYNQLLILGAALSDYTVSKETVVDSLGLTNVTLSRYLKNINNDLLEFYPDKQSLLKITGDRFTFTDPTEQPDYDIFHKLLTRFLSCSNIYQTLKALLFKNKQQTALLLDNLNISQSYFNKIIKEINRYFACCHVQIVQRNKQIYFTGDETHILFLEFLIRQYANKFDTVPCICSHPFPELIDITRDHTLTDLNDIQLNRMTELHHIFKKRSDNIQFIHLKDPEVKESLALIVEEADLLADDISFNNFSEDARLYANLLARISSSQLEDAETKHRIGKRLSQSASLITRDCLTFIDKIIAAFLPTLTKESGAYFELVYMMHIHLIYIRLFGTDFKQLFTLKHADIFQNTCQNQETYQQLILFFADDSLYTPLTTRNEIAICQNKNLFIDASYSTIRNYRQSSVTISFDFIYRLSFEYFIQNHLRKIFNESAVIFTYDSESADIVVTDHLVPVKKDSKLFPFINTNSRESLEKLLNLITTIYSQNVLNQ